MQFSPGSVFFGDATFFQAPAVTGAFNGTSLNGTKVQLGQPVGTVSNPASLIADVEIPMPAGTTVWFGKDDGLNNIVGISPDDGVNVVNNTGSGFSAFFAAGGFSSSWQLLTGDFRDIEMIFTGTTIGTITYNGGPAHINRFETSVPFVMAGMGGFGGTKLSSVNPAYSVLRTDVVILYDTTGGNASISADPVLLIDQFIIIKKVSSDINSITVTPLTGTIQEIGAPAGSFAFNIQGQSIMIWSDGTNLYII